MEGRQMSVMTKIRLLVYNMPTVAWQLSLFSFFLRFYFSFLLGIYCYILFLWSSLVTGKISALMGKFIYPSWQFSCLIYLDLKCFENWPPFHHHIHGFTDCLGSLTGLIMQNHQFFNSFLRKMNNLEPRRKVYSYEVILL